MLTSALSALLADAIDYAGLFPPAALQLPDVVRNYRIYEASADAWALGRLIIPAAKLSALPSRALDSGATCRLSVLASPGDFASVASFARESPTTAIDAVETAAATAAEVNSMPTEQLNCPAVFVEVSAGADLPTLLDAIAHKAVRAKLRTGGVTPAAFPSTRDIARFITMCRERNIPWKATAGLHHPLRGDFRLTYEEDAPRGTMYGYLNIMLAALVAARNGALDAIEAALLATRISDIQVNDERLQWRNQHFDVGDITRMRAEAMVSFGSCSFTEPMDELRALALL